MRLVRRGGEGGAAAAADAEIPVKSGAEAGVVVEAEAGAED